jgi:hypothetical protein
VLSRLSQWSCFALCWNVLLVYGKLRRNHMRLKLCRTITLFILFVAPPLHPSVPASPSSAMGTLIAESCHTRHTARSQQHFLLHPDHDLDTSALGHIAQCHLPHCCRLWSKAVLACHFESCQHVTTALTPKLYSPAPKPSNNSMHNRDILSSDLIHHYLPKRSILPLSRGTILSTS